MDPKSEGTQATIAVASIVTHALATWIVGTGICRVPIVLLEPEKHPGICPGAKYWTNTEYIDGVGA